MGTAFDKGFQRVWLEVKKSHFSAVRVYEKCGFEHVREAENKDFNVMEISAKADPKDAGMHFDTALEVGSEFSVPKISVSDNVAELFELKLKADFGNDVVAFSSGRHCFANWLQVVTSKYDCSVVFLPNYLCECFIEVLRSFNGLRTMFYPIDKNMQPELEDLERFACERKGGIAVLVGSWFGFPWNEGAREKVRELSNMGCVVLEDRTHSLFTKGAELSAQWFASLRKWTGMPCGAILVGFEGANVNERSNGVEREWIQMREKAMLLKHDFLNGEKRRDNSDVKKVYLQLLQDAEHELDQTKDWTNEPPSVMSKQLWVSLFLPSMKQERRANYAILWSSLSLLKDVEIVCGPLDRRGEICPFGMLIRVKKELRNALRSFLIERRVYCAVHWPRGELSAQYLTIPCDQRYNKADMERVSSYIHQFFSETLQ